MNKIRTLMVQLAKARQVRDNAAAVDDELRAAYERTPEYQAWKAANAAHVEASLALQDIDHIVRDVIISDAMVTGERHYPGCEVKTFHKLTWNEADVLNWAETNAPSLIVRSLNEKAFKKVAMELGAPVEDTPSLVPYINSDLSTLLEEEEE